MNKDPSKIIFFDSNIILVITVVIINSKTRTLYLENVSIIDNISNFRYHHTCFFDKCCVIFVSKNNFFFEDIDKKTFMPAPIHEISESEIKNKLSFNAKISSI